MNSRVIVPVEAGDRMVSLVASVYITVRLAPIEIHWERCPTLARAHMALFGAPTNGSRFHTLSFICPGHTRSSRDIIRFL